MGVMCGEICAVGKMAFERDFVPPANLPGIQVIDHSEGVELVKTGCYIPVLDICQTTQMNDEVLPPSLTG
jgi:hypothetical protein